MKLFPLCKQVGKTLMQIFKRARYQISYSSSTSPYFEASKKVRVNSGGMDPWAKVWEEVNEIKNSHKS